MPEIINRDIKINLSKKKIVTIAGVRRSGKTSLMFQCIKDLLNKGIKKENIIYIDFENERLINTHAEDLDNLLIANIELFRSEGDIYLFLDEIQNINYWDKWVRKIYNMEKYYIIITGSSSKLLSSEIATSLAGRNITYMVYPFSFNEFINAKHISIDTTKKYSIEKGIILKELNEFLNYGSFPEMAFINNENTKIEILSSYFDAIFYKDIIRRYNVREINDLNIFLKIMASNYGLYFSSVKLYRYFLNMNSKISRTTIINFLYYSISVFMVYKLEQYKNITTKRISGNIKTYIIDTGISILFSDIDRGRSLENAVFMHLIRNKKPYEKIYFMKLKSGKEIDFLILGKNKEILQVSYDVSNPETKNREVSAIIEASKSLNLNYGTIITYNYTNEEIINGIKIIYKSFWEWSLEL